MNGLPASERAVTPADGNARRYDGSGRPIRAARRHRRRSKPETAFSGEAVFRDIGGMQ